MMQVATALLFVVAAIVSLAAIIAMLKNNQFAIVSALAGRGAFPKTPAPEKGPAAQIVYAVRPVRRAEQRGYPVVAAHRWNRAA